MVLLRHPHGELRNLASEIFPGANGGIKAFRDNYLWFMSGGGVGQELQLDNIFLWRDKSSVNPSAVDSVITEENAPIEIYTLTGLRIGSMSAPGIYIVRKGNDVKKVFVR